MYTQTKSQIIEIIKKNGDTQVRELVSQLGITQAAIHRALNKLIAENILCKKGSPPKVFYSLARVLPAHPLLQLTLQQEKILADNYLYIDPTGLFSYGTDGFLQWMRATKNNQKVEKCIEEYIQILQESDQHKNKYKIIDATARVQKILQPNYLDQVFYFDFYSLVKFGKTQIGQLLLHGKQAQDKKIIQKLSAQIKKVVEEICKKEKIEAIVWAPHSIPRKVPFLKEVEKNLALPLPTVEVIKAYRGPIPIAQKSLSKVEERILNARETMVVVPSKIAYKKVLLFDDAVGSGATMNEIAQKLKAKGVKTVIGFAIVGSYKGFEVIREV